MCSACVFVCVYCASSLAYACVLVDVMDLGATKFNIYSPGDGDLYFKDDSLFCHYP